MRKADWIDASKGALRKGISRANIRRVQAAIPALGFYETLARLGPEIAGSTLRAAPQFRHVFKFWRPPRSPLTLDNRVSF
ncbi:MAG: hypothetical protein AAGF12_33770 [Myxococcota bacterium]